MGTRATILMGAVLALLLLFLSPESGAQHPPPVTRNSSTEMSASTASSLENWPALLKRNPYPFQPPPPPASTPLDGTYVKVDPKKEPPIPCRRCPDYAPEGGRWWLHLDRGIFRIFHETTGWKSLGSFTAEGNRLLLFNDPCCHETNGIYTWRLKENQLILEMVEDECAIRLRAANLTQYPWLTCLSSQLGPIPPGCP